MSNVFWQPQLLRCQTIGQCMMLNADTCGQGEGRYEKGSFFVDVLYGRPFLLLVFCIYSLLLFRMNTTTGTIWVLQNVRRLATSMPKRRRLKPCSSFLSQRSFGSETFAVYRNRRSLNCLSGLNVKNQEIFFRFNQNLPTMLSCMSEGAEFWYAWLWLVQMALFDAPWQSRHLHFSSV